MAYLGSKPSSGFITTAKQRITSSTNNYVDLDNAISSLADVIVWVNFVKQDSTNLTLTTSTRITLGGTLVSSDIVEIAYLGKAVATQNPSTNSVTNDMLAGSIANSKLLNSSNTPNFLARLTSHQTISDDTMTKVQFNTVVYDSDNAYDNSTNYRFQVPSSGKYFYYSTLTLDGDVSSNLDGANISPNLNGSSTIGGNEFIFLSLLTI